MQLFAVCLPKALRQKALPTYISNNDLPTEQRLYNDFSLLEHVSPIERENVILYGQHVLIFLHQSGWNPKLVLDLSATSHRSGRVT